MAIAMAMAIFRHAVPPESQIPNRPRQIAPGDYATSSACKACHPREYATWFGSYHRTMTQVATPETARAPFDGVVAAVHGRPMQLSTQGSELWAEFDDPDSNVDPDRRARITRRVVMITGSHNQQIYWYATGRNRMLGQLPGAYLLANNQWIPRRAAVLHPPSDPPFSETGHWNSTCIACHATDGRPRFDQPFGSAPLDTQIADTEVTEFGIACEACHGPSGAHARANHDPLRRYQLHFAGAGDRTAAQPARFAPKQSSQICGQCHGIWEFYDEAGERDANVNGLPFRPGDDLTRTRFVAQPTVNGQSATMQALLADDAGFVRDSFWADGKVRVSGREYNGLLESPCFRKATDEKRTLSCFSCHTLHKQADDPRSIHEWADDQLGAGKDGNEACLQCHDNYRGEKLTAHTRHGASSSGSSCYNCHMPFTTYGLLKAIRSHTISSPSVTETTMVGRPNACNLCHLDKTLAWTSRALREWYGIEEAPLGGDEQRVAASLLQLLRGDASQRAIVAAAMGWPPAQQASGTDWMVPHLAQLLDDPYDAVRFVGARSLRTLPGFVDFSYDLFSTPTDRRQAQLRTMRTWDRTRRTRNFEAALLFTPAGDVDIPRVVELLKGRSTRRVLMRE
jgi:hypothetical protein